MKAAESLSQIVCWNCEELVHRYATHCPYCQKDLARPTLDEDDVPNRAKPKISQPVASPFGKIEALPHVDLQQKEELAETEETLPANAFVHQAGHVLLSLFSLLAGSFFFFFGLLLLLFSENGTFSLEWKASSWPYFVFSAMFLLLVGLWSVTKIEK